MSDRHLATAEAGSILYKAAQAVSDNMALAQSTDSEAENRKVFLFAMRLLAVHAAIADEPLSEAEGAAIEDIFWLANQVDNDRFCSLLSEKPELVEQCIAHLEHVTAIVGNGERFSGYEKIEPDLVLKAVEQVLETVIACDGSAQPELDRLTTIIARVRAATPTGQPAPDSPALGTSVAASASSSADAQSSDLHQTLAELDQLVGLTAVKKQVETLVNLAKVFAIRRKMGLPVPDMSFHLAFLGNPGTGKTTVARIIARLYGELGLLSKGQLVEVDRSGLVANFVGQTATKVEAVVQQAMGGVLFIDEAYALDGGAENDFGHEAVATLIKAMEDHRSDLVVIAAGYTDQMQRFLDINPGIRSRIGRTITFDDYSPPEMVAIFRGMAAQERFALPGGADAILATAFQRLWDDRGKDFANARDVRNAFERVVEAQATRLCSLENPTQTDMTTITAEDLGVAMAP